MQPIPGNYHIEERHSVYAICTDDVKPGQFKEVAFIERVGWPSGGSVTSRNRTTAELLATARMFALAPQMLLVIREMARIGVGLAKEIIKTLDAPDDKALAADRESIKNAGTY